MDLFGAEWLRRASSDAAGAGGRAAPFELPVRHDEFEYGFHSRVDAGTDDDGSWSSSGQTSLWPNGVFSGNRASCRFEWRVPLEDERTLNVAWFFDRAAPGRAPAEDERHRHWHGRLREDDSDPASPYLTTHELNRRFKLWLTTKKTLDRTKEHLVDADRGIVLLRNRYFAQLDVLADGGQPKGVIRRESDNRAVPLPLSPDDDSTSESAPLSVGAFEFPYIAGQPPDIEALYRRVRSSWSDESA